jgi:8-oxo-dGTP pyrophosphatase MutT (NUDIX family)
MTRVGVGAVIWSSDYQRVLLLRYSGNGEWARPGGKVEPCETCEDAVIREVLEEVGLDLGAPELRPYLRLINWAEGAALVPPVPWVAAGFAIRLPRPELEDSVRICEPDKHDAIKWMPVSEIIADLDQATNTCRSINLHPFTIGTLLLSLPAERLS